MKKTIGIVLAVCVIGIGIYFSRSSQKSEQQSNTKDQTAGDAAGVVEKNEESHVNLRPKPAKKGDASEPGPVSDSKIKKTIHQPSDFTKGDLENMIVTDGLQLGNNPAFLSRLKPFRFFGVYISPEQPADAAFDRITPNFDLLPANESEVTFEFRTKPANADWTVWEEVALTNLNQPSMLESPAMSWQYRLTFYANDPAASPKVRNVSMISQEARSDSTFSANNNTN